MVRKNNPCSAKKALGQRKWSEPVTPSGAPTTSVEGYCAGACVSSHPSGPKVVRWLCLKYSNQPDQGPVEVRDDRSKGSDRWCASSWLRMVSLSFCETLGPRPTYAPLEVITQKVKSAGVVASTIRVFVGCSVSPAWAVHVWTRAKRSRAPHLPCGTESRSHRRTAPFRCRAPAIRWSRGSR